MTGNELYIEYCNKYPLNSNRRTEPFSFLFCAVGNLFFIAPNVLHIAEGGKYETQNLKLK